MKSDVGNISKSYLAWNAMNGDYCAGLENVGVQIGDTRNYNKDGWIGFSNQNGCPTTITLPDIQITGDGICTGALDSGGNAITPTTQAACAAADTPGAWTAGSAAIPGTLCTLEPDQFVAGSYSNVMDIDYAFFTNDDSKVLEYPSGTAPNTAGASACPPAGDWN